MAVAFCFYDLSLSDAFISALIHKILIVKRLIDTAQNRTMAAFWSVAAGAVCLKLIFLPA